jgi:urease subunit gamma/beta
VAGGTTTRRREVAVHLDPTEMERLLVFSAAELARRSLADGVRLSAPEAVAIVCDEMHRAARRGAGYEEVVRVGRSAVSPDDLLDGVEALVPELRVEVLLDEGSRLVVLPAPFGPPQDPGIELADEPVEVNVARPTRRLEVHNTSSRPVRVSSHLPFHEANPRLEFDRELARGYRLDLPAGDTLRWAPGERREVGLVAHAGEGRDLDDVARHP